MPVGIPARRGGGEGVKNGFSIFLAAFIALGGSWRGFVHGPVHQLGGAGQTTVSIRRISIRSSVRAMPRWAPGLSRERLRRLPHRTGPANRHRVRCGADGRRQKSGSGDEFDFLPRIDQSGQGRGRQGRGQITAAGGKSETHIVATGPDIARGWGMRQSVAEDYLYDQPVQLGSLRAGPDLANVGVRAPTSTGS